MFLKKLIYPIYSILFVFLFLTQGSLSGQTPTTIANAKEKQLNFIKITEPVRNIKTSHDGIVVKSSKVGYHPKTDWPLHDKTNKDALPIGADPAWQKLYSPSQTKRVLLRDWEGLGADGNFSPGDPSLDVGPNHVVQMVNGQGGSNVEVWDKNGNSIATFIFDGITNIGGAGDPIVIYDQLADRWLLSEFAPQAAGNTLIIGISTTPDPTGSYAIYSFTTPEFPDYPKYAIWNDSYIVTTNESNSRIYALDRTKMLAGDPSATAQQFNITNFNTIGFQAATPVNLDGTRLPPTGAPGMFMRMADDGWTGVTEDRLEIFEMNLDFDNATNSTITGPIILPTDPFDTELNGFTAFSAIAQPGTSIELDPLRELLMNKIIYRHFGSYEALVCNHVTDVTGNDDAGVRWYELRRTGGTAGSWTIYQQGTYSPDNTSRWMASIGINEDGSIGLAYNVSNATDVFPGLRYTGRNECDPLGSMTYPETTIIDGTVANSGNRWGDYNTLSVDPVDGSFWFTGQYSKTSAWSTRVAQFDIPNSCAGFIISLVDFAVTVCEPDDASFDFELKFFDGFSESISFSSTGFPDGTFSSFSANQTDEAGIYTMTVSGIAAAAPGNYPINISATDGTDTDDITVTLSILSSIENSTTLLLPADNSIVQTTTPSLSWSAVPGASSYTIELSTDLSFSTIIEAATISETSYLIEDLAITTAYFWRVTPENLCGLGPLSSIFSFETANIVCLETISSDTPTSIAADGTPTITSSIVVEDDFEITDVNILNLDVSHSYVADLTISLTSPGGLTVVLVSAQCTSTDDIVANFDDVGIDISCPISGGTFAPQDALSIFNGEMTAGTWILTVEDEVDSDGGALNSWTLELCGDVTPPECPTTAPNLSSPLNASIGIELNPSFNWTIVTDATSYTIEIATDAEFLNIIETANPMTTSYSAGTRLDPLTPYFWRVQGVNLCGAGPFSSSFTFETVKSNCMSTDSEDTPISIPSEGTPTISSSITIEEDGLLTDLNILNLDISHTYVSDLTVSITSPSGTTALILQGLCGAGDDLFGDFDDAGVDITCPISGGSFIPADAFSIFNGESSVGTWTLTVSDAVDADGGQLNSWTLELCGDLVPPICPTMAPNLTSPLDMSTGVELNPSYSWTALSDVTSYRIEIATDSDFLTIIETTDLSVTSYTSLTTLDPLSSYFWRVTGVNSCGAGPVSATQRFETVNSLCNASASADTPIIIPEAGTPTISSSIMISDVGVVSDLNILSLDISHTYVSDLTVSLTSPSGVSAIIVEGECSSTDDLLGDFDDAGVDFNCPISGGSFKPTEPFSIFNSESIEGIWTLTVSDVVDADGGSLNSWTLELCTIVTEVDCPPDYANENQLTGTLSMDAVFKTDGVIVSNQLIDNNALVDYNSGTSVLLIEDFEVTVGSTFHVFIDGCDDSNTPSR